MDFHGVCYMMIEVFRPNDFQKKFNDCWLPHLKTFVEDKLKLRGQKVKYPRLYMVASNVIVALRNLSTGRIFDEYVILCFVVRFRSMYSRYVSTKKGASYYGEDNRVINLEQISLTGGGSVFSRYYTAI